MPNTERMQWPYPSENQDPWYESFRSLMQGQDASGYASREDRHVVLFGGGTMTFTASSGLLTWANPISILAAISGFKWYVAAGSINLNDGQVAYVDLSRYPTTNTSLAIAAAAQVPSTDSAMVLCVRIGDKVFFRNGRSINDGSSIELLDVETGTGGGVLSENTSIADRETNTDISYYVAGAISFDPDDFPTAVFRFSAVAAYTGAGTGQVQLYNLDDAVQVALFNVAGGTPTRYESAALTLLSGKKTYEVRIKSGLLGESLILYGAQLETRAV